MDPLPLTSHKSLSLCPFSDAVDNTQPTRGHRRRRRIACSPLPEPANYYKRINCS